MLRAKKAKRLEHNLSPPGNQLSNVLEDYYDKRVMMRVVMPEISSFQGPQKWCITAKSTAQKSLEERLWVIAKIKMGIWAAAILSEEIESIIRDFATRSCEEQ